MKLRRDSENLTELVRKAYKLLCMKPDSEYIKAVRDQVIFGLGRVKVFGDGTVEHIPTNEDNNEPSKSAALKVVGGGLRYEIFTFSSVISCLQRSIYVRSFSPRCERFMPRYP